MPLFVPTAASVGVSGGNVAGNTGLDQGAIALAGGNNITLSQDTSSAGASITVSAWVPSIGRYDNFAGFGTVSNAGTHSAGSTNQSSAAYAVLGTVNGSMQLFPLNHGNNIFPGNMTASTLYVDMMGLGSSANSAAQTLRYSVGIYTLAGASTLSLLNSGSTSITAAATTNQSTLWNGARYLTVGSGQFSASLTFSQTNYWVGIIMSSSAATQSLYFHGAYQGNQGDARSGTMGVSGTTNNSRDWTPWAGVVGTAALPASIHISGVTKTGASGGFYQHLILENLHSAW